MIELMHWARTPLAPEKPPSIEVTNSKRVKNKNIKRIGNFKYGLTKVEIDEELLKEIANETGGIYFRATDNKKLKEIYDEINKLEKTEIEEFKYYNYTEKYRFLVLIAIVLIIFEWIAKNTLFKSFI